MKLLLIDGDVLAYQACLAVEEAVNWGDGFWTWHCDENKTKAKIQNMLDDLMKRLKADEYRLCLTDSEGNFRKSVLATYKGNRSNLKKPLLLKHVKQWLVDEYDAYLRPGLEGDDCMGILATVRDKYKDHQKIIVSIDKDMRSIPGFLYMNATEGMIEVSKREADIFHLIQTLTGDPTDGYSGCPKIGLKKARKIIDDALKDEPEDNEDVAGFLWPFIVKAFEKAGLSEEEALTQARVARILRADDYDFKKKEPILWNPSKKK